MKDFKDSKSYKIELNKLIKKHIFVATPFWSHSKEPAGIELPLNYDSRNQAAYNT